MQVARLREHVGEDGVDVEVVADHVLDGHLVEWLVGWWGLERIIFYNF